MKISRIVFFFFLIGLWSCGAKVSKDISSSQVKNYKTYSWIEPDIQTGNNPIYKGDLIENNIKNSIRAELASKGFQEDNEHPDFLVSYHTYTERRVSSSGGYYGSPFMGFGYGGWGGFGMMGSAPRTYSYTEGILVIDLIDSATHQTLWRGSIEGNVDNSKHLSKKIHKGVHSILKKLPAEELTRNHKHNPEVKHAS